MHTLGALQFCHACIITIVIVIIVIIIVIIMAGVGIDRSYCWRVCVGGQKTWVGSILVIRPPRAHTHTHTCTQTRTHTRTHTHTHTFFLFIFS